LANSYLIYPDKEIAQERSAMACREQQNPCQGGTTYWWNVVVFPGADKADPDYGKAAVEIRDGGPYGPALLTATERQSLISRDKMRPEWFPAPSR
jgi:hypothetical protein